MTWLLNSPEQNLPMILADNGFDVWIANTRGTSYSRRHIKLDPSNPVGFLMLHSFFSLTMLWLHFFAKIKCNQCDLHHTS